jgi:enoyl-CoA hydratase/carnithine racemase
MVDDKHIDISIHNNVMKIGLNRPDKKNALTSHMYDTMGTALLDARENPDIKVVLFHGTKDLFSAGNDLKGFDNRDPSTLSPGAKFLFVLQAFEKPVVAAVSGIAIGIGVTLLLHCDLVYADDHTRFRMPFVNLGVCPEAGSSLLLPACAGYKKAAEILMLGEFFDATQAVELGIVNRSVSNVLEFAIEKAELLAQKPQQALLSTKRLLKKGSNQLVECMTEEFKLFNELLQTPESINVRAKLKNRLQSRRIS